MQRWFLNTVRLASVESGRSNNLNLIRLLLASSVILSHAYPITGHMDLEPMVRFSRSEASLGDVAVIGFFFLSGYLILRSALRHPDPTTFLRARALRIFPGLTVAVFLSVFLVGMVYTEYPIAVYFSDFRMYRYLLNCILDHHAGIGLPGVFINNAIHEVNLPLWTLSSEWTMYTVALLVCIGIRRRRILRDIPWHSWFALCAAVLLTAQMFPLPWKYTLRWALAFLLGSLSFLLRKRVALSIPTAIGILAGDLVLIRCGVYAGRMFFPLVFVYFLLVASFHPLLRVRWFLAVGDFSYGLYIYGWPVEQIVSLHLHTPMSVFVASYGTVLPLAAVSWLLVESPSLALNRSLSTRSWQTPMSEH